MLTKGELINSVWPDVFVEEGNLAQSIFLLRRALGEAKGEHRFIVTMPGAGYYFAPRVRALEAATSGAHVDERSIGSLAVLPFTPLGEEEDNKAFGVGLADALTMRLSRLEMTPDRVEVMACCAPTTSPSRRLTSDPVCARVKKAIGWRCT